MAEKVVRRDRKRLSRSDEIAMMVGFPELPKTPSGARDKRRAAPVRVGDHGFPSRFASFDTITWSVVLAANVYECLFLLDSNHFSRDPHGTSNKINDIITGAGGETLASRLWTEQKLAYPVDGHRKGSYWLAYFRIESTKLAEFERACRLNESILRHLTIKIDPRLQDALVAHALGQTLGEQQPAEAATAG